MQNKDIILTIFTLSVIIIFLAAFGHLMVNNTTENVYKPFYKEKRVNITVIDKTSEIVGVPFSSRTEYLILGNNGTIYYTLDWKIYRALIINKEYSITVRNLKGHGYTCDYWLILNIQ